jgi:hypothetical protein
MVKERVIAIFHGLTVVPVTDLPKKLDKLVGAENSPLLKRHRHLFLYALPLCITLIVQLLAYSGKKLLV